MAFIENLNADSLGIRAEDFDRYMSGAATPHDPSHVITTCDGLRLMQQNVAVLVELRASQERLMAEAMQLQQDMVDFCAATRDQVCTASLPGVKPGNVCFNFVGRSKSLYTAPKSRASQSHLDKFVVKRCLYTYCPQTNSVTHIFGCYFATCHNKY